MSINIEAQKTVAVAGEYYLEDVREIASGFKLKEDSTFEFFFSYGGLDRGGEGKWQIKNGQVILNSTKPAGQDFALVTEQVVTGEKISIQVIEANTFFLPYVHATIKSGKDQVEAVANSHGLISFPKQPIDSLVLTLEFTPEKSAVFSFTNKAANYFEFRFEPWCMDVIFDPLVLTIDEKGLKGHHPLLKEDIYHFLKK